MGGNAQQVRDEARQEDAYDSSGAVEIHESETGEDIDVGHTPGKAEGVDEPERQGNE